VLVSDGKLSDARQALDRYRPEPGSEQEIRLSMQLHLGVTVTADDAQVMISITGRLPDGEFRDAIIAMLIREAAVAKSSDTFPADLIAAIAQLEADTRNRPGTGLRIDPSDDTALRAALQKRVPDQAAYQKLLGSVQAGTACMADIAAFAERPYGTVLLHRPAGILPAADLAPGLRAAGEKAARQAVEAGACAADLSSLHLPGLLADDDRLRIRSALPSLTVARSAIDDALLTRDHVRNLSAATYTASLAPDGTIDRTAITTTEQALLRTRAETLETITESAHASRPATPAGAAADAVAVAVANQLPFRLSGFGFTYDPEGLPVLAASFIGGERLELDRELHNRRERQYYGIPLRNHATVPAREFITGWVVEAVPRKAAGGSPNCTVVIRDVLGNEYPATLPKQEPQTYV
jgi:hypothetical protein